MRACVFEAVEGRCVLLVGVLRCSNRYNRWGMRLDTDGDEEVVGVNKYVRAK